MCCFHHYLIVFIEVQIHPSEENIGQVCWALCGSTSPPAPTALKRLHAERQLCVQGPVSRSGLTGWSYVLCLQMTQHMTPNTENCCGTVALNHLCPFPASGHSTVGAGENMLQLRPKLRLNMSCGLPCSSETPHHCRWNLHQTTPVIPNLKPSTTHLGRQQVSRECFHRQELCSQLYCCDPL